MCNSNGKYSFSFMEMINSYSTGKTSATAVIGTITCFIVILVFISLAGYFMFMEKNLENIEILKLKENGIMDIIDSCVILFGMGSALLGVRNVSAAIGSRKIETINNDNKTSQMSSNMDKTMNSNNTTQLNS